jgi:hypothetical protein
MASNTFETSRRLPGICPPLAYMTTKMGFLLSICCLASARVAATAATAVAAALAAVVIGARSIIVAIEQEDSKLSFDTLGLCNGAAQADGLLCACCGSPDGGSKGEYSSLPAAKVWESGTGTTQCLQGSNSHCFANFGNDIMFAKLANA